MNRQSTKDMLQGITREDAVEILSSVVQVWVDPYRLEYYAWPQVFPNTGGPFTKPGGVYGQAMTTFTIEAWVDSAHAVLFCKGKVIGVHFYPDGFDVNARGVKA